MRKAISREKLRDPNLNAVDLSGIPNYTRSDVLTHIHKTFAAERINEKLFINVSVLKFYMTFNMLFTLLIIVFELSSIGLSRKTFIGESRIHLNHNFPVGL